MIPSRLKLTGFDETSIYFQTLEEQDVFFDWRDLPITESMSSDALRQVSERIRKARRNTVREAIDIIEHALETVEDETDRKQLQEVFDKVEKLW